MDEILLGVLVSTIEKNQNVDYLKFRSGHTDLVEFFEKNKNKYSLLNYLRFSGSQRTPRCQELYEATSNLAYSGLICFASSPQTYEVSTDSKDYFDRNFKKNFSENELSEIKSIGRDFWFKFGRDSIENERDIFDDIDRGLSDDELPF